MDKILSARVDEAVLQRIGLLAEQLKTTKKAVIEGAIRLCAEKLEGEGADDVLDATFGCWHREEAPEETVEQAREAFRASMGRHRS